MMSFLIRLEGLHFGSDPADEEETLLQTAANADLLILDDLGSEFNSAFLISSLYSLLNNRLGAKLPTIGLLRLQCFDGQQLGGDSGTFRLLHRRQDKQRNIPGRVCPDNTQLPHL